MRLPDAIAPYASLLKWLLIVGLLVAVRVEGCTAGKRSNDGEIAVLEGRVDSLNASLTGFIKLYDQVNAQADASVRLAAEHAKRADMAEKRADKAGSVYVKEVAQVDRDLIQAKRDPTCNEILERPVCAALR